MERFISFNVKNFFNTSESEPEPQVSGEYLLNVNQIVALQPSIGATETPEVQITLTSGKVITVLYSSALVDGEGSVSNPKDEGQPLSNDYSAKAAKAISDAMTSNPGGAKASVILPQDTDGKQMYWRTYLLSS